MQEERRIKWSNDQSLKSNKVLQTMHLLRGGGCPFPRKPSLKLMPISIESQQLEAQVRHLHYKKKNPAC